MKVDDKIDLIWQGNDKLRGDGNDIVDANLPLSHTVRPEDLLEKDDRLDDDPNRPVDPVMKIFVDFAISYAEMQKIKPAPDSETLAYGSAWVTYTITAQEGAANTSETDRANFKPLVIDARPPRP
jgi:hypothetical protein